VRGDNVTRGEEEGSIRLSQGSVCGQKVVKFIASRPANSREHTNMSGRRGCKQKMRESIHDLGVSEELKKAAVCREFVHRHQNTCRRADAHTKRQVSRFKLELWCCAHLQVWRAMRVP
jgi:hypothetical protein